MSHAGNTAQDGRNASGAGQASDWYSAPEEKRDWKKVVLIAGLGALSWVATYVGMLELIEANLGELPLVHKLIIGFSVAMLMIMIVWLLDQLFAPLPFVTKALYAVGYVFLTLISVGFGFGFYWKVLESRGEASRSAEGAVGQVQNALLAGSTRLDQLQQTLVSLTAISRQKAENERATGTSCPNSRAGDGPRRKMREDDAARFEFASNFVKGRATHVKGEIAALEGDLLKISKDDRSIVDPKTGTRNEFMKGLSRKLDQTVTGFNAFRTDPQLKQIRADLAERADKSTFPDSKGGTYACPDPQLSAALKGVVRAIEGLPELERPKIATVEGSEATIEAFRRLTSTLHGLMTFKMPPSADEQRELQKKAVQLVENPQAAARQAALQEQQPGLSKRDWVPLAVAMFVDLCLLLVSMGRPINRLGQLVPKMRAAERGPVIQILSRFSDIHRDEGMRQSFEVLRHVVFDYAGAYYVAVPLDAPFVETRREQVVDPVSGKARLVTKQIGISPARREELRVEAHLIANLFASFEKDSVFKRVMWLNTESARRRLQQQGSKFANAEAFRIYRFADGAWSEIILGAVMGAARRVEARRGGAADGYGRREPTLDALFDRMRQAELESAHDSQTGMPRPKPVFDRHRPAAAAPGYASGLETAMPDPEMQAQFGPYASAMQEERAGRTGYADRLRPEPAASYGVEGYEPSPTPEAPNVLPFKAPQPQARAAGDDIDGPNMRMPSILTRGQAALAQQPDSEQAAERVYQPDPIVMPPPAVAGVIVTATERKLAFELPASHFQGQRGLLDVAGMLARRGELSGTVAGAHPEQDETPVPAEADARAETPEQAVAGFSGPVNVMSERSTALTLPAPIRAREQRG